jgi:glycosyltransferase involved in cell wall biosynthesis
MTKTILFVTASPGKIFGGGKRVFYSLIKGLDRNLFRPVVACSPEGPYAEMLHDAGVELCTLNMDNRNNPFTIYHLAKIMREESVTIVHSQGGGRSNYFAFLAAHLAKVPIKVATVANLVEGWSDVHPLRRLCYVAVNRLMEKSVDTFICVAHYLCEILVERHGIAPEKVINIPNGIDVSGFVCRRRRSDILRELGLPANKVLVSLIGRLVWEKGIDVFLEAACELSKGRTNIHFLVVGAGPLRAELEQQARDYGLADLCSFAGFQRDIPAILMATDIMALPSFVEGLPMIILEAMASKVPVVASAVGGIPEMIQQGGNGFLVPAKDSHSLAEKLLLLINNKGLRKRMGEAARKDVEELFSETEMIHKTQQVYLDLIRAKGL